MGGCFSYAVVLSERPLGSESRSLSEAELRAALTAVANVAVEFRLTSSSTFEQYREAWAQSHPPITLLALYVREADRETRESRVFVAAYLDGTNAFSVLVRAWDNVGETEFSRGLRERLRQALDAALPTHPMQVERVRDLPILFRP